MRYYLLLFCLLLSLASKAYYPVSPYAWCGNNTMRFVDPDGRRPIYNINGDFLGTDDEGLQGDAIIMSDDYFKQRMSTQPAKPCRIIWGNLDLWMKKHKKNLIIIIVN